MEVMIDVLLCADQSADLCSYKRTVGTIQL